MKYLYGRFSTELLPWGTMKACSLRTSSLSQWGVLVTMVFHNVVICFSFKHEYQPRTLISSSIRWGQEYFWFPVQMSFLRYHWQILSHTLEHNSLFNNIREYWMHRLNLEKDLTVENNNDPRSASWLILTLSFIVNQLCVLLESYGQLLF